MRALTLAEILVRLGTRAELEHLIQGMIEALDELDGDADLEPSLGSVGGTAEDCRLDQTRWAHGGTDEAEIDGVDAGAVS